MDDLKAPTDLDSLATLIEKLTEFAVEYGFQILGALVFLVISIKVAGWLSRRISAFALSKGLNQTLAYFIGNVVKIILIVLLAIVTLGNFGISIAPIVALAGASAFGATLAIQGPLSNYGAGIGIIIGRPFVIGDTIAVGSANGVVEKIGLGATILSGEDGEVITIPNKEIVGRVIVNSDQRRVVETKIAIRQTDKAGKAVDSIRDALSGIKDISSGDVAPQVGIHDFTYGGVVIGARFWVPSKRYYQTRYAVNRAILDTLRSLGITLADGGGVALDPKTLSGDDADGVGLERS
ncbi:MAG: mechanosensitive ion channel family protein [Rhodospirillales bacterium]